MGGSESKPGNPRNSIWSAFTNSSEANGVKCRGCTCNLPANNWYFVSNECKNPRYDDDVFVFFSKHEEVQTCSGFTLTVGPGSQIQASQTIHTRDIVTYFGVGGKRLKPKAYFCLSCFRDNFDPRGRGRATIGMSNEDKRAVANEAITLCIDKNIGILDPAIFNA